jgi:fructosamine-3-kinase
VDERLRAAVAEAVGQPVLRARPVSGGDVARSYRVELADGRTVFAKTHDHPRPEFFVTEAVGLRWLRESGQVNVPEVLAVTEGTGPGDPGPTALLVLAWIPEAARGRPEAGAEREFGRALARLHGTGAPAFGREDRRPTGSLGVPNDPAATWPQFYAERRLLPLARIARDRASADPRVLAGVEAIAGRLAEYGAAGEPPARLHGDLWAGNRIVDLESVSWLIDPAAQGGHREFDLAMMRLFGGFGPAAFAGYEEESPLAGGWLERVPLHQLAPLLVHAIKFGGGYRSALAEAVTALGG